MKYAIRSVMSLVTIFGLIAPAHAQAPVPKPSAQTLQLADLAQPISWRAGGPRLMYLHDGKDQWFRVDLLEPCMDLFPGKEPRFVTLTSPNGERYSGVIIERRHCSVTNIAKMAGIPPAESYVPPPKAEAKPAVPKSK